ncbi:NlpC-P60 family protein (plasmid) [Paraburkholderia sp. PGU19]|nr:NlpC-P60 family protein [Paraburkholderia sp. PGU19]
MTGCANNPPSREVHTAVDPIRLFPMAAYDQDVDHWIDPSGPDYDKAFLNADDQRAHFEALYARYFGTGASDPSPWNPAYVDTHVYRQGGGDIVALQRRRLASFDNTGKAGKNIGYGENFQPHTAAWIESITQNMDIDQFDRAPGYTPARRAIATGNLLVRELPTMDPFFYDRHVAGEGYPFDDLQISAVRPGTPLFVLGSSLDGGWRYVQTPDVQGWVRSEDVGMVNDPFVSTWREATHNALGAVTVALAAVRDSEGAFRFEAPAGSLLPMLPATSSGIRNILVPARDADGRAIIRTAHLSDAQISPMPLSATPRHLAMLLKSLIGRPYGWGNTNLYNDCSSELQSIFAAFGVWLPRHSSTQMSAGHMIDLSDATTTARLEYLTQHGKPLRTLIYIGGHVMLYLGNTTRDARVVPVIYQDIWGLRPADNSRRAVIGGSVIMPLLARIPEDPTLESLAGTPIFRISILGAPRADATFPPDEDIPAS